MKTTTQITWTTNTLTRTQIDGILGAQYVAGLVAAPNAAGACRARAVGMWDANECEHHAAYRSLERLLA